MLALSRIILINICDYTVVLHAHEKLGKFKEKPTKPTAGWMFREKGPV